MAVYTKEYESQPEAILTNVIICPAVDLSANVAVPVHCHAFVGGGKQAGGTRRQAAEGEKGKSGVNQNRSAYRSTGRSQTTAPCVLLCQFICEYI